MQINVRVLIVRCQPDPGNTAIRLEFREKTHSRINIILTALGGIPNIIHTLWLVFLGCVGG